MKQTTFASAAWANKGKVTRRERFLGEMDAVISWKKLIRRVRPHYAKAGQGRQPHPLEIMLRIHCLQHFFNLSAPGMEEALYDSESMRRFAGLELGEDAIPDESTILRFRHLLERHGLAGKLFAIVGEHPGSQGAGGEVGDDRGCHDHCRPAVDQEQGQGARSRDAADPPGPGLALWDEAAHWH